MQVTIASVRAHGVSQLLVYCLGKREGDWPCHHFGKLPIESLSGWRSSIRHRTPLPLYCLRMAASRSPTGLQQAAGSKAECRLDDAAKLMQTSRDARGALRRSQAL